MSSSAGRPAEMLAGARSQGRVLSEPLHLSHHPQPHSHLALLLQPLLLQCLLMRRSWPCCPVLHTGPSHRPC